MGKEAREAGAEPIVQTFGADHFGKVEIGVVVALHVGAGAAHEKVLQHVVAEIGRETGETCVELLGFFG